MTQAQQESFFGAFLASRGGMLVRVGTSLMLIGLGALAATNGNWVLVGSSVALVAIAIAIAGVCMSLSDYPVQAIVVLLILPPALWVWYMGLPFVASTTPAAGWASVAIGLVPLVLRGRGRPAAAGSAANSPG